MTNKIKSRILLKTDTTNNWARAENSFIPQPGEVCIYSDGLDSGQRDSEGSTIWIPLIKIGNGRNYINELPYINYHITNEQIDTLFISE